MADVDALSTTDPQPANERLVHVAEQQIPRLSPPDRIEERRAATFHPPRYRVEKQLGNGRRDVRAEHIDRADGCHLRRPARPRAVPTSPWPHRIAAPSAGQ